MDELERFRIRMIGEEHNRKRRLKKPRARVAKVRSLLSTLRSIRFR